MKPYVLTIELKKKVIFLNNFNQAEVIDLQDLSKSAIKHLIIKTNYYISLTHDIRSKLAILFNNPNIKFLDLHFYAYPQRILNTLIVYLSKLLEKNNSVAKIALSFLNYDYKNTHLENKAMAYLFYSVRDRLFEYSGFLNYICDEKEIKKFIYNSNNLKRACFLENLNENNKYLFCSNKIIDNYTLELSNDSDLNNDFWNNIFNIKYDVSKDLDFGEVGLIANSKDDDNVYDRIKIANLELSFKKELDSKSISLILNIIRNCYILKVENLKLPLIDYVKDKIIQIKIVNEVLKLSLNSLNTVKRVSFSINSDKFKDIFTELDLKEYDMKKIPKIYLIHCRNHLKLPEVMTYNDETKDDNHSNTSKDYNVFKTPISFRILDFRYVLSCEYTIRIDKIDDISHSLIDFLEFISIFNNCYCIYIKIEDIEKSHSHWDDNKDKILDNLLNSFKKYYSKEINSERKIATSRLSLEFKNKQSAYNSLYFTILKIMISQFKINSINIINCPLPELISFMNKNINKEDIYIMTNKLYIDVEDKNITVDDVKNLYSFTNIIKDRITLNIFNKENELFKSQNAYKSYYTKEIIAIFDLIKETNSNFIDTTHYTHENIILRSDILNEKNALRINSDKEMNNFIDEIEKRYYKENSDTVIRIQYVFLKSEIPVNLEIRLFSVLKTLVNSICSVRYYSFIQKIYVDSSTKKFCKKDKQVYLAALELLILLKTKKYYINGNNDSKISSNIKNFYCDIVVLCEIETLSNRCKYSKRIRVFKKLLN